MNIKQNRSDAATSKRKEAVIKRLLSLKTRLRTRISQPLRFRKNNVNAVSTQQKIKGFIPVSEEFVTAAFLYDEEAKDRDDMYEGLGWEILGEVLMRIMRLRESKVYINPFYDLAIKREVKYIKENFQYEPIFPWWIRKDDES